MADNSVAGLQQRYGDRWRWLAVATVMAGTMSTVLSATVVNVALYDIMLEFGVRQGQIHWLATGFIAAMTTTMLASSWLLDHFGIRKTLATAMALFTVISVLGGFAASPEQLIAARIGQGAMAGLMQPMAMFLVFRIFPRNQRGRAMGIYGMGVVLAPALGPVLGGFLVDELTWRYVMFAPVPVTAAGVFMVWRFLPSPENRPKPYPLDVLGLVLLGATIGLSLDSLSRLQNVVGQGSFIAAEAAAALLFLTLFVWRERSALHPLVNIALLRKPVFLYANLGAMAMGLALFGSTYLIPLFAQTALGSSAISFTRQLGGAFGVNMVALAIEHGDHRNGMPTVEAFQFAWWMVAVFLALAIIPVWKMRT